MPGEQLFLHVWLYLHTLLPPHWIFQLLSPSCLSVPEDLSLEERDELSNIRRRKRELLDDIEVCVCVCVCSSISLALHCNECVQQCVENCWILFYFFAFSAYETCHTVLSEAEV